MTYASSLAAISRQPCILVRLTLDFCTRTFGVSPCLATGNKCYNTRASCTFTTAYQNTAGKVYRFTSNRCALPFKDGERPYVESITVTPLEIAERNTILGRATVRLLDEPDSDVGIDPYVANRSSVQGTFWKKLLARNPNCAGRDMEILLGFVGDPEAQFTRLFLGRIENIKLNDGMVTVEGADRTVDLTQEYLPAKLDIKLRLDFAAADTTMNLSDVSDLAATGWVRIEDEIVQYTTRNTTANFLTGLTRGAFGTVAADHDEGDHVDPVQYYAPAVARAQIAIIFSQLGFTPGVDYVTASLTGLATPDLDLPLTEGVISKPTKVSDLIYELLDLADAQMWVNEDGLYEFARKIPNKPGRTFTSITDDANIVLRSASADLQDGERLTRVNLYWDRNPVATSDEDVEDFSRLDIAIDPDAEGADWYGEESAKSFFSRFLRPGSEVPAEVHEAKIANFVIRKQWRLRDAPIHLDCELELKDAALMVGKFVRLSTSEIVDMAGNPISDIEYQVVKREIDGNRVRLRLRRLGTRKIAYVAPDTSPVWASATAADKVYGFISDDSPNLGRMDDLGNDGYYIG